MLSAVNAKDERTFGTQVPRHTPCTPCSLASALSPLSSAPWPCPRWRHAKSLPAHSTLYMGVLTHFPLSFSLSCHTLPPSLLFSGCFTYFASHSCFAAFEKLMRPLFAPLPRNDVAQWGKCTRGKVCRADCPSAPLYKALGSEV